MHSVSDPPARTLHSVPIGERLGESPSGQIESSADEAAAERLLPNWDPAATVQVRSVVPLRATVISRIPPPPDPGFAIHDLLNLPFEAPGRYAHTSLDGESEAEIGRGGIGRVLLALDQHLGREVALKELLPQTEHNTIAGSAVTRFLSEARITGQLEHPNIVPVYELGRRSDGRLYYSMRVVRGETLGDVLHRAVSLEQRMVLLPHLSRVCNAIAYAHSRGVIHRDIKPDNIMIGEFGETVVLDWGIAKVSGEASTAVGRVPRGVSALEITSEGGVVGTPLFMSPEQLSGRGEINETSDVWSLGVVLYFILCGKPPFDAVSLHELRGQVLTQRPIPVRHLGRGIPPELAAIARRALLRKPEERYPSAQELARDLDAYMAGQKVSVYTYGPLELLRRFARRNRAASWVALLAILALLSLAAVFQSRVLNARDRAVAAEQVALERAEQARNSLAEFFSERAMTAYRAGDFAGAELNAAWSLSHSPGPSARGLIVSLSNQASWEPIINSEQESVKRTPGRRSLTISEQGRVEVVDSTMAMSFGRNTGQTITAGILSAQGDVVALGGRAGSVTLWWPDRQKLTELEGHRGTVLALAFSSDGLWLASAGAEHGLAVWDVQTGARLFAPVTDSGHVSALTFSPDDRVLAAATNRQITLLDMPTGERLGWVRTAIDVVDELWFSANDVLLAKSGSGQVVGWQRRSVAPSMLVPQILRHRGNVLSQVYVDENTLATAGLESDGVCLWDTRTGDCTTRLPVQGGQVRALAVGGGGQVLGVGISTGRVYLWDTKTALPLRVLDVAESAVRGLAFDTSGAQLFTAGAKGELAVWASSSGRNVWSARTPDGVFDAAFDARSDSFWVTTRAGGLEVWDQSGRRNFRLVVHADWAMGLALHQATQRFATIGADGALALGQTASKHVQLNVTGHVGRGLSVDISPDGALLATGAEDGVVLLWQAQPMRLLAQLPHHRGAVRSVRFSPRGTMLSSAGDDGTVRLWDLARLTTDGPQLIREIEQRTQTSIDGTHVVLSEGGSNSTREHSQ